MSAINQGLDLPGLGGGGGGGASGDWAHVYRQTQVATTIGALNTLTINPSALAIPSQGSAANFAISGANSNLIDYSGPSGRKYQFNFGFTFRGPSGVWLTGGLIEAGDVTTGSDPWVYTSSGMTTHSGSVPQTIGGAAVLELTNGDQFSVYLYQHTGTPSGWTSDRIHLVFQEMA